MATDDEQRVAAFSAQLREAHQALRDQLSGLRAELGRRELDGLTAITESHFRYEERSIGAALDHGVADTGWSVPPPHRRPLCTPGAAPLHLCLAEGGTYAA